MVSDDIKAFMESEAAHPRTHMMTNIYAESDEYGIELRFRIVALIGKGLTSISAATTTNLLKPITAGAPITDMFRADVVTSAMQKLI